MELLAGGRRLRLGQEPLLMGIVNAAPDSFSDGGRHPTLDAQLKLAARQVADGAQIIDIGGESGNTRTAAVAPEEEIARTCELIDRVSRELGVLVSADTYKPAVARAAIAAGAAIVNDTSGLRDPALADVCAAGGAGLVVMHTRAAPKQRLQDPSLYGQDIAGEVVDFLRERMAAAQARGVPHEGLIVDPGPDFAKTPAQTIRLLRDGRRLHALERPILLALSRKDFIGALTGRKPRQRQAGTLAALAHGLDIGGHIFRVHDVGMARELVDVLRTLRGDRAVPDELSLDDGLRWDTLATRADGAGAGG